MDLDDFDAAVEQLPLDPGSSNAQSPKDAVRLIDAQWYTPVSRRGRWMDLIGDYAGSEPFVVDGAHLPLLFRARALNTLVRRGTTTARPRRPSTCTGAHRWYSQHTVLHAAEVEAEFIDVSFQIVHAIYTMERVLHEISSRSASFEIVFWHGELIHSVPLCNLTVLHQTDASSRSRSARTNTPRRPVHSRGLSSSIT